LAGIRNPIKFPKVRDTEAKGKPCEKCGKSAGYAIGTPSRYLCLEHYISFHKYIDAHPKEAHYTGPYGKNWWDVLYNKWLEARNPLLKPKICYYCGAKLYSGLKPVKCPVCGKPWREKNPIRHTKAGWFWGSVGPQPTRAKLVKQIQAIYARGYRENPSPPPPTKLPEGYEYLVTYPDKKVSEHFAKWRREQGWPTIVIERGQWPFKSYDHYIIPKEHGWSQNPRKSITTQKVGNIFAGMGILAIPAVIGLIWWASKE